MKIVNKEGYLIEIRKINQWYFKQIWSGENDNYFRVENGKEFKHFNAHSFYITTTITFYFLCFRLNVKIKPKLISSERPMRFVQFKDKELESLGIDLGSWPGIKFSTMGAEKRFER